MCNFWEVRGGGRGAAGGRREPGAAMVAQSVRHAGVVEKWRKKTERLLKVDKNDTAFVEFKLRLGNDSPVEVFLLRVWASGRKVFWFEMIWKLGSSRGLTWYGAFCLCQGSGNCYFTAATPANSPL